MFKSFSHSACFPVFNPGCQFLVLLGRQAMLIDVGVPKHVFHLLTCVFFRSMPDIDQHRHFRIISHQVSKVFSFSSGFEALS
jgi:hypothetical protein